MSVLHDSKSFAADLRSTCANIAAMRVAGIPLFDFVGKETLPSGTRVETKDPIVASISVSESAAVMRNQTGLEVGAAEWANKLKNMQPLSVAAGEEEVFQPTYVAPLRIKKKAYKIGSQEWFFLAVALLVIAFLVTAIAYMGDSSSDSQFSNSFESIFKFYRK
jgi:hypothetical protein